MDGHVGKSFRHPKAIWIAVQLITEVCEAASSTGVEMEAIEGTLDLESTLLPARETVTQTHLEWCGACFRVLRYFRLESSMWRAMKGEQSGINFSLSRLWMC